MTLAGKHILIGITGGIAAYKICSLIRDFKKSGADVKVICTPNALNFVTRLTLQNLSQGEVYVDEFCVKNWRPEHVSLADWADVLLIAPCSANTIGKIAQGIADNLLTSVACAFSKKMIVAPAMNCNMWQNEAVRANIKVLRARGVEIVEPESGFLACGYMGKGRLCSLDKIFRAVEEAISFAQILKGKKVVVTSGGTIEEIDPVRFISNYSSGKMGFALASVAYDMGAEVVLITTKEFDAPYRVVKVKSAVDMECAVKSEISDADYVIMAAAVADYRVKEYSLQKIKKGAESITLELVKNPDILAQISQNRPERHTVIVGFCAESENLLENAGVKIAKKGCDFLVANDISRSDIGFNSDENEVYILSRDGGVRHLDRAQKRVIAREILECISTRFQEG